MTVTGQTRSGAVITLLVWGAAASGIAPIFQNFLYHSAPDIPEMAGALAASSINVGVAAGSAVSGLTAWQGLFDHAGLKTGQTVLIHGAAGGVGSMAVQLAHELV